VANHWREYECMLALATVGFELGWVDDVLRHLDEVAAAARRICESEVPFADALAALARLRRAEPDAGAAVELGLTALRKHDDKARLAYALNAAATFALATGDKAAATRHATEALAAATGVRRPTLIAGARPRWPPQRRRSRRDDPSPAATSSSRVGAITRGRTQRQHVDDAAPLERPWVPSLRKAAPGCRASRIRRHRIASGAITCNPLDTPPRPGTVGKASGVRSAGNRLTWGRHLVR
jgi:hypothetical protein